MKMNMHNLSGKSVLLTGAAGHLGRAMARAFAASGARLLLNDRAEGPLEALCAELRAAGADVQPMVFDICDPQAVRTSLGGLESLDVLVNNAIGGLGQAGADAAGLGMLESGLLAVNGAIQVALPALRAARAARGDAAVINIASIWGHVSPPFPEYGPEDRLTPPHYAMTKGGILQLTRYLACQLGPEGVRVNSVSPGLFPWENIRRDHPELMSRLAARTPLGRNGEAEELAGPVVFLASEAARFITGTDLKVDGGYTAW